MEFAWSLNGVIERKLNPDFIHSPFYPYRNPQNKLSRSFSTVQMYFCIMDETLVNKVSASGLVSLDLEDYYPKEAILTFDLKDHLFMGLILKEKDFREALKNLDWSLYKNQNVAIVCSADAIIPSWAYMLIVTYLQPLAKDIYVASPEEVKKEILLKNLNTIAVSDFTDQRVVVKGCGDLNIGSFAYAEITKILLPVVKSIMYGEPCSTVPIFKRK
jgi:hypothetical protein